jgi:carbamoyltransferase
MNILGINFMHGDSSACIFKNDYLQAAAEEERFNRIKHFSGFPYNSIKFCLEYANLNIEEIDIVSVNFNSNYNFKEKFLFFLKNLFNINLYNKIFFINKKKSLNFFFENHFNKKLNFKIDYVPHHYAHISSSYLCSGLDSALGISIDGSGDFSTCEFFLCNNKKIQLIEKSIFPHSLGIFYQTFTQFLGFDNYGDEFKVMGLAAFGKPIYKDRVLKVFNLDSNSFINLNLKYFLHQQTLAAKNYNEGSPRFRDLFSNFFTELFGKKRDYNDEITQYHKDIAASVQVVFEEIIINKINQLQSIYKSENLCLAGGCAMNSSLNGKIIDLNIFKKVFIPPNPGDGGGAIGAALFTLKSVRGDSFKNVKLNTPFLGTSYSNIYISKKIIEPLKDKFSEFNFNYIDDFNSIIKLASKSLKNYEVIAWFQDRMEFGPRALGNRSIIANPSHKNVVDLINLKIKKREDFRPFAPAVLDEYKNDYFENNGSNDGLFMSAVYKSKKKTLQIAPGVVHVNNTARVQIVTKEFNEKFYLLIKNFYELTGIPILINTSLNISEPICESPQNAVEVFLKSNLDKIFLQNWVISKK